MPDHQQLVEQQNRIVHCLAKAMNEKWDFLVVNYEQEEIDGEWTRDTLALVYSSQCGIWMRSSFILPYDCTCEFFQLSQLMSSDGKGAWGTCTLEVESSGKYRFSFSYGPPKRLNGVFDDDSMLKGYTPKPL